MDNVVDQREETGGAKNAPLSFSCVECSFKHFSQELIELEYARYREGQPVVAPLAPFAAAILRDVVFEIYQPEHRDVLHLMLAIGSLTLVEQECHAQQALRLRAFRHQLMQRAVTGDDLLTWEDAREIVRLVGQLFEFGPARQAAARTLAQMHRRDNEELAACPPVQDGANLLSYMLIKAVEEAEKAADQEAANG